MSSDGSDWSRIRGDLQQVHQSLDLVHLLPLTPVWCFRPVQSGFNGPVSAFNAHLFFSLNQDGSWFPVTEPGPGLGSGPAARQMEGKAGLDQMWMGAGSGSGASQLDVDSASSTCDSQLFCVKST